MMIQDHLATTINNLKIKDIQGNGICKELGQLTQGYHDTEGTNTCVPLTINKIKLFQKIVQ